MPDFYAISPKRSLLVVIDVQEKLIGAMHGYGRAERNIVRLLLGAQLLSIPALISEQYPKGLGKTVEPIRQANAKAVFYEKRSFALGEDGNDADKPWFDFLSQKDRPDVLLSGIEAHVCVLQTALKLCEKGHSVRIVADAVTSRTAENKSLGIARARSHRVDIVSTEMVLFEWMQSSKHPNFRQVSALIKDA